MKKFNNTARLLIFSTTFVVFWSCTNPTPPDPYIRFAEQWKFTNAASSVDEVSADPLSLSEDVSDKEMYLQFYTNQDFVTNADLSLTKLLVDSGNTFRGTYYYFIENGEDRMVLEFFDPAINEDVALYFIVENMSSNTPSMIMNTNDFKTSINESADEINSEISDDLKEFANRIITANFTLEFEKQ